MSKKNGNESVPTPTAKETAILELLAAHSEMFGLELVEASNGLLKRGTVYVVLYQMEEQGLIRSRLEDATGEAGKPRRLYQLTGYGSKVLEVWNQYRHQASRLKEVFV